MTVYGPRINVHPDRTGAFKSGPNRLIVIHTAEGGEGDTSAENLGSLMTRPGDRPSTSGGMYGASYGYVTDTDRVLPAVPDNIVSYSAAGANNDGIHICIPGRAAQTREQWLDGTSYAYLVQLASVMRDLAAAHQIPLDRLTVPEIVAGKRGYCAHADISNAYHRSDHTDPGPNFPWDVLAQLLDPPPQEVPMFQLLSQRTAEGKPVTNRLIDTRQGRAPGAPIEAGAVLPGALVTLTPKGTRPEWARGVAVTVTSPWADRDGYIIGFPTWTERPTESSCLNPPGGMKSVTNTTMIELGPDGKIVFSPEHCSCHLVVEQLAWTA